MSSKRRLRAHSCTAKKRFASLEEAENHVAAMLRYHGTSQKPYACPWGAHWHVTTGYRAGLHAHKARGKVRVYRGIW